MNGKVTIDLLSSEFNNVFLCRGKSSNQPQLTEEIIKVNFLAATVTWFIEKLFGLRGRNSSMEITLNFRRRAQRTN